MRRGSKAPTMMFVSQVELDRIDHECPDASEETDDINDEDRDQIVQSYTFPEDTYNRTASRRMSAIVNSLQMDFTDLSMTNFNDDDERRI